MVSPLQYTMIMVLLCNQTLQKLTTLLHSCVNNSEFNQRLWQKSPWYRADD